MPLSEQEQRLLEEMERSLYHNDADFVATVGVSRLRPNYRSIAIGVLLAVGGIVALIAGVALHQLWLGILGFAVMFTGVLVALSPSKSVRKSASTRRGGGNAAKARKPEQGFMDRLNDRWDRRQDENH
jgi:VIT1/CCC1 family predicted Fe2+/Mn2+ transporter